MIELIEKVLIRLLVNFMDALHSLFVIMVDRFRSFGWDVSGWLGSFRPTRVGSVSEWPVTFYPLHGLIQRYTVYQSTNDTHEVNDLSQKLLCSLKICELFPLFNFHVDAFCFNRDSLLLSLNRNLFNDKTIFGLEMS